MVKGFYFFSSKKRRSQEISIKSERLCLDYQMNHFAIKGKIYIETLEVAYKKVEELMIE